MEDGHRTRRGLFPREDAVDEMAGLTESLDVVAPRYEVEQVVAGAFGPPLSAR